ncbi:MAG: hypothetical protein GYB65_06525 [Chloroflexi bacterium]|nr:hypothetical protein [Chloroflexota bacterium]
MNVELFLQNNDNLLPRNEVKIESVAADPYPDRQRIKISVQVTPFRERPNLEIVIRDSDGSRVAGTSVIESMVFNMEFVLHLRNVADPAGNYTIQVLLYYDTIEEPQDTHTADLHISAT